MFLEGPLQQSGRNGLDGARDISRRLMAVAVRERMVAGAVVVGERERVW